MESVWRELRMPVSYLAADAFLEERGWSWRRLREGNLKASPRDIALRIWHDDPVEFAEHNLINRDDGSLWQLFDYQKPSMRYRGHALHWCASQVGKSREILALNCWSWVFHRGDQLIAAAFDGALEDLWAEFMFQLSSSPFLRRAWDEDETRVKPYRRIAARSGNAIHMRPAAHDGRAFRGVHVRVRASFDEVALIQDSQTMTEFYRAAKRGCEFRLLSVPLEMQSDYSAKAAKAPKWAPELPYDPQRFVLFHWSRTDMPPPPTPDSPWGWDENRRAEMIELYGGEDTPGYRRNVLGIASEPDDTVFPRERVEACVEYLEEYRRLEIVRDGARVRLVARALNPAFRLHYQGDGEDRAAAYMLELGHESRDLDDLDPEVDAERAYQTALGMLRPWVQPLRHAVVGADLGKTTDPTELIVDQVAERWRWSLRLQIRRLDRRHQAVIIAALDELLGFPAYGIGLDATAGGAEVEGVMRSLNLSDRHSYRDRLSGFVLGERVPEVNVRTGEASGRKVNRKELGTRLLEQQIMERRCAIPHDDDLLADYPRHTASAPSPVTGDRKFLDKADHTIDAQRCALLRWYEVEHGPAAPSGPITHAATGSRREEQRALPRGRRREMRGAFGGR